MKADNLFKIFIFIFTLIFALLIDFYFDKRILSEIVACEMNISKGEVKELVKDLGEVEKINSEVINELEKNITQRQSDDK